MGKSIQKSKGKKRGVQKTRGGGADKLTITSILNDMRKMNESLEKSKMDLFKDVIRFRDTVTSFEGAVRELIDSDSSHSSQCREETCKYIMQTESFSNSLTQSSDDNLMYHGHMPTALCPSTAQPFVPHVENDNASSAAVSSTQNDASFSRQHRKDVIGSPSYLLSHRTTGGRPPRIFTAQERQEIDNKNDDDSTTCHRTASDGPALSQENVEPAVKASENGKITSHILKQATDTALKDELTKLDVGISKEPTSDETLKEPTLDETSIGSTANGTSEEPTADETPTEPPADGTPKEPALDRTPKEPRANGTSEEPALDGTPKEPPADGTSKEPSTDGTSEVPTADGTSEEPPADRSPKEPPADRTPKEPRADGTSEVPPADGTSEEPTLDGTPKKPPADETPKEPPADGTSEEPTLDGTPKKPPADETPKEPPADGMSEVPTADGTPKEPPADGTPKEPRAEGTSEEPPADGTPKEPRAEGTSGEPPADRTPKEPRAEGTSEVPTADGTSEEPTLDGTPKQPPADGPLITVDKTPKDPVLNGTSEVPTSYGGEEQTSNDDGEQTSRDVSTPDLNVFQDSSDQDVQESLAKLTLGERESSTTERSLSQEFEGMTLRHV